VDYSPIHRRFGRINAVAGLPVWQHVSPADGG
jgi:hypothetical protein